MYGPGYARRQGILSLLDIGTALCYYGGNLPEDGANYRDQKWPVAEERGDSPMIPMEQMQREAENTDLAHTQTRIRAWVQSRRQRRRHLVIGIGVVSLTTALSTLLAGAMLHAPGLSVLGTLTFALFFVVLPSLAGWAHTPPPPVANPAVETRKRTAQLEGQLGLPLLEENAPCGKCGAALPLGAKFCPRCRASTTPEPVAVPVCDACGARLPEDAVYCQECGERVHMPVPARPMDVTQKQPPATTRRSRRSSKAADDTPDPRPALVTANGIVRCPYCQRQITVVGASGECSLCGHRLWYRDGALMGKRVGEGTATVALDIPLDRLTHTLHPSDAAAFASDAAALAGDMAAVHGDMQRAAARLRAEVAAVAQRQTTLRSLIDGAATAAREPEYRYRNLSDLPQRIRSYGRVEDLSLRDFVMTRENLITAQGLLTLYRDLCHPDLVAQLKSVIAQDLMRYDRYREQHPEQA